jgi:hypothetical protein
MLHAGVDLSRRRLDVSVIYDPGELVEELAAPPDADGLRYLTRKVGRHGEPVRAVIESITGARIVHDTPGCWRRSPNVTWCRRSGCLTRGSEPSASTRGFGCIWSSTSRCSSTASTPTRSSAARTKTSA